jgi:anti-sigma regulatory factor (Ser/Thr protein kinase)
MKTTLAAGVGAPAEARAFVATQLAKTRPPMGVHVDTVVLIVSELVTNAVQAGATSVEIDLQVTERRLDLVVIDDAAGWPTPINATPDDTAGRGLSIVEQIADTWDVNALAHGKAITASWFDRSESMDDGLDAQSAGRGV